jgi:hypothetical protein
MSFREEVEKEVASCETKISKWGIICFVVIFQPFLLVVIRSAFNDVLRYTSSNVKAMFP